MYPAQGKRAPRPTSKGTLKARNSFFRFQPQLLRSHPAWNDHIPSLHLEVTIWGKWWRSRKIIFVLPLCSVWGISSQAPGISVSSVCLSLSPCLPLVFSWQHFHLFDCPDFCWQLGSSQKYWLPQWDSAGSCSLSKYLSTGFYESLRLNGPGNRPHESPSRACAVCAVGDKLNGRENGDNVRICGLGALPSLDPADQGCSAPFAP